MKVHRASILNLGNRREWLASRPGRFTPLNVPRYPLNRSLGGSKYRSVHILTQTKYVRVYFVSEPFSFYSVRTDVFSVTKMRFQTPILHLVPIPAAARSKVWICGRSLAGIVIRHPLGAWMCGRKYTFIRDSADLQSSGKEHGNLDSHCSQFFGFHYTLTSCLHFVPSKLLSFCPRSNNSVPPRQQIFNLHINNLLTN